YQQNKDLSVELAERLAESHKSKVHRVEHQLDGHENGDDIALENEGEHSEPKQNRAQDYVVVCWDHLSFSPAAPEPSRPESPPESGTMRSEEHTSELQSRGHLVCRL